MLIQLSLGIKSFTQSTLSTSHECIHPFSLLRVIWIASLILGARNQRTDAFPAQFELSSLDGSNGFTLNGELDGDNSGYSVSSAGDVNGDGIADIVIGAYDADPQGRSQAGRSYVVFGSRSFNRILRSDGSFELSNLNSTTGFFINGEASDDFSGRSISSAGDVNGDGIADIVIGAYEANPLGRSNAGKSYVIFGSRNYSSLMDTSNTLELSSLNGSNGFILNGESKDDNCGISVSDVGDINGDGIVDLVIGAHYAAPSGRNDAGKSYVVFGSRTFSNIVGSDGSIELTNLKGTNGFILNGENSSDWSGYSVSSAGDVNGDGIADLIIGAHRADYSGKANVGKSYVVFGRRSFSSLVGSDGSLDLSSLNGSIGFIVVGTDGNERSGISVSAAGDVNGDGIDDLLIGAHLANPQNRSNAGRTYIVFGRRNFTSVINSDGYYKLSNINGKNGLILNGEVKNDESGESVSSAGDVNGDGLADVLIGANHASLTGRSNAGKAYVVYGNRNFSSLVDSDGSLELSKLNGSNGFILNGAAADDRSGRSVSIAGDFNGDGAIDFLIGASNASPNGMTFAGKTYVIYGRKLSHLDSTQPTRASSSLVYLSSSSTTSMGLMKSNSLTRPSSLSQTPTTMLMTNMLNSLEHSATSSQLTNDEQSFLLPLVLSLSGVFCFSGILIYVINIKKCKKQSQYSDHKLKDHEPEISPNNPSGSYQSIPTNSNYESGNINVDNNQTSNAS